MKYKSKLPQWNKYASNSIWFLVSFFLVFPMESQTFPEWSHPLYVQIIRKLDFPFISRPSPQYYASLRVHVVNVRLVDQLQRQLAQEGLL